MQNYNYDSLNRLDDAVEYIDGNQTPSWRQDFSYDRYGNRNFVEANTTFEGFDKLCANNTELCADLRKVLNPSANASDNRLSSSDGYVFDPSGNTVRDPQSRRFTYDGENKQVKVETLDLNGNPVSTVGEYSYDGDGRRIKKHVPSTGEVTVFVYDVAGKTVAEYSTQISQDPKVSYTTSDHLGSPRILTDQNGSVISRRDFHPFGGGIATAQRITFNSYTADTLRRKFTTYDRDSEADLDFAQARMYGQTHGRFTSVDPFNPVIEFRAEDENDEDQVDKARERFNEYLRQPQHWNRYAYGLNSPYLYVDNDGRIPVVVVAFGLVLIRVAPAIIASARMLQTPQGQRLMQAAQRHGVNLTNFTLSRGGNISSNVFQLDKFLRGNTIEALRGVSDQFARGFPVIDKFNFNSGVATSIKSIDIFAKSYQNMSTLASTLARYVNSLANFRGGARNGVQVNWFDIRQRVLEVVLPSGNLTLKQAQTLRQVQEKAAQQGVRVVYVQAQ